VQLVPTSRGVRANSAPERRGEVTDLLFTQRSIVALTDHAVVNVYSRADNELTCSVQTHEAQALFLNPAGTLVVVHCGFAGVQYSGTLRVAIWNTESLERGMAREQDVGEFNTIAVDHPGFIEFDDVNGRIVVHYPEQKSYHVWDMATYKRIFVCSQYKEMRVARGLAIFFSTPRSGKLRIHYRSMEDGKHMGDKEWRLDGRRLIFIEQFHEFTLLKEDGLNVRVLDGFKKTVTEIPDSHDLNPVCFQYTLDPCHFFTLSEKQLDIWDVPGFKRTTLLGVTALNQALLVNVSAQVVFAIYTEEKGRTLGAKRRRRDEPPRTVVAAFRFADGAQVACFPIAHEHGPVGQDGRLAAEPPQVVSLAYDEERQEFCTGMDDGLIYRWSP
jgi:hypothetical protein